MQNIKIIKLAIVKANKKLLKNGFTILEIIIALTILGVLGALSYNPLINIYNNQQNESQAQNILNNLRAAKQQAISLQQNITINIAITKNANNIHTLEVVQTFSNNIPAINWQPQISKQDIILNLNNQQLTNAIININNRGDVLTQNNSAINSFNIIYDNYGIKLSNNRFEKCSNISGSNLPICN